MSYQLYSKRNQNLPDVFIYDHIPEKLKNQFFHIWDKISEEYRGGDELYKEIHQILLIEYGLKELLHGYDWDFRTKNITILFEYYKVGINSRAVDKFLDLAEILFKKYEDRNSSLIFKDILKNAISDFNYRCRENGFGYEYNNHQIIRVDNQLMHKEAIQETLLLINEPEYKNASNEFMKALEHYKNNLYEECFNECLKAFESTMKVICHISNWPYDEKDAAKKLITILKSNNFFLDFQESFFNNFLGMLENSTPTLRNKLGGHGSGTKKVHISDPLARYMLNMTGSNIRLLIETQRIIN